jgi:inorganic pyrophosphatase
VTRYEQDFWQRLDELMASSTLHLDRPKGTPHPRYPTFVYPLDYGYLEGTAAVDGSGLDVWLGSLQHKRVTAIMCTVDLGKRDAELKLLLGCTAKEARLLLEVHNIGVQSAILVERPAETRIGTR